MSSWTESSVRALTLRVNGRTPAIGAAGAGAGVPMIGGEGLRIGTEEDDTDAGANAVRCASAVGLGILVSPPSVAIGITALDALA
jgi:hypothetical protein